MSFAYMPFFTGDYYRDTRHLSMLQHGAYRQLLDHCWDQKGPLPLEMEKCYRICGAVSKEERDAVVSIVQEYFTRMDDGHYNKRMAEEVAKSERLSKTLSSAGLKSAEARRSKARQGNRAKAEARLNQGLTKAEPSSVSPSPSPSPSLPSVENIQQPTVAAANGVKKPMVTDPDEIIFGYGVPILVNAGTADKHARSFLGGLRKQHGDDALIEKLRECLKAKPLQPLEWLGAALPPKPRPGKQGALEARNAAVAKKIKDSLNAID